MKMKKEDRIILGFVVIMAFFTYYLYNIRFSNSEKMPEKTSVNTGTTAETGDNEIKETETIIPDTLDDYMDYIIENGIEGEDFISFDLEPHPSITYKDKSENNEKIIFPYLKDNMLSFSMPYTDKKGYIAIITKKPVSDTKDIFLGVDGGSKGPIRKNKSLSEKENVYMYELNNVVMAGTNGWGKNLYKDVKKGVLNINAFVGESGNYVEKIIIFFK